MERKSKKKQKFEAPRIKKTLSVKKSVYPWLEGTTEYLTLEDYVNTDRN